MSLLDDTQDLMRERRVRMSEEEFLALEGVHAEWVNGEAIFMSPVSVNHARLVLFLLSVARACAQRSGTGEVLGEPVACRLPSGQVRMPDVFFVRSDRAGIVKETIVEGAPDLVMEVVSPESRDRDFREKYAEYESAGVTEYWVFDPVYVSVDLHRLDSRGVYTSVRPRDGIYTSTVLSLFSFDLEWMKLGQLPLDSDIIQALPRRQS